MGHVLAEHDRNVRVLSEQMKKFYAAGIKVKIYHGSTNSTRAQKFEQNKMLDISELNNVIEVNAREKYALLEPNVPMDALVRETVKHGLVPAVVPEFPGITIGGAVQGGAGESSSFTYGGVHECCEQYEIMLGSGDVIRASRTENADLFWGTAGSCGTLGVITLVKLRLIPATRYVRLRYKRFRSTHDAVEAIRKFSKTDADFIDGIIFSETCAVIMIGTRTDEQAHHTSRFLRAWDEWFYLHVKKVSSGCEEYEETIPLTDYLFRYDRGGFWVAWYGFKRWSVPFNRIMRFIFNPFMKTRELYDILHATNVSQQFIVQDICIPEQHTERFVDFIRDTFGIYPLWLLPVKFGGMTPLLSPPSDICVIDVGVWGEIPGKTYAYDTFLDLNRKIERETNALRGRKMLYAHVFYPKEEFWKVYDLSWYETLRRKYHAERAFPDVYEKVYVGEKYSADIKRGLWSILYRKVRHALGLKTQNLPVK